VTNLLYRIVTEDEWTALSRSGSFAGAAHDLNDGYIHLSAARQVEGTLQAHYPGRPGLLLLTIHRDVLEASGGRLVWEPSRGGELFPHFYGKIPLAAVVAHAALLLDRDGKHVLPELDPGPL
jgi:uncharacterized protein (DUF952 family)